MAQLLDRFQVCDALMNIIENANEQLIIISPYIKLNHPLKDALLRHKKNKELKITIVYGKNEEDKRLSISDSDFDFFKTFPNIEIRYHKRLHAKMYANDLQCLVTSMNLHEYSYKNNIEVGVLMEFKMVDFISGIANILTDKIKPALETQAQEFAEYIVSKGTLHYAKSPKEEKSYFGFKTTYGESEVLIDKKRTGYCIRYKEVIPFNEKRPYSERAYKSWEMFKNKFYTEKYCHGCGKVHETSMAKPLCQSCFSNK